MSTDDITQLTEKPVTIDEMHDKAVEEARNTTTRTKRVKAKNGVFGHKSPRKIALAKSIPKPIETADHITFPKFKHEAEEPETATETRVGRKSGFNQSMADKICRMAMQGFSLRMIEAFPDMPDRHTIAAWAIDNPVFNAQFMQARVFRAQQMADEILDIADHSTNDYMEIMSKFGESDTFRGWRENGESTRRSAIRIDVRKFLMAKLFPRIYGDRIQVEVTPVDLRGMSKEASEAMALLLDKLTPPKEE